jgi:hypothetical protein
MTLPKRLTFEQKVDLSCEQALGWQLFHFGEAVTSRMPTPAIAPGSLL